MHLKKHLHTDLSSIFAAHTPAPSPPSHPLSNPTSSLSGSTSTSPPPSSFPSPFQTLAPAPTYSTTTHPTQHLAHPLTTPSNPSTKTPTSPSHTLATILTRRLLGRAALAVRSTPGSSRECSRATPRSMRRTTSGRFSGPWRASVEGPQEERVSQTGRVKGVVCRRAFRSSVWRVGPRRSREGGRSVVGKGVGSWGSREEGREEVVVEGVDGKEKGCRVRGRWAKIWSRSSSGRVRRCVARCACQVAVYAVRWAVNVLLGRVIRCGQGREGGE